MRLCGRAVILKGVIALICFSLMMRCNTATAQSSSLLRAPLTGSRIPVSVAQSPQQAMNNMRPSAGGSAPPASSAQPGQMTSAEAAGDENLADPAGVDLPSASWTYQPAAPLRVFRKNDVVTIRVDEITRMLAEGAAEGRKRTLFETILTDWISLSKFRLRPDQQASGDPSVAAEANNIFRAESTVETRESMSFNIAATVVDIRPNGNMLLEARKKIRVNDNLWETSLTGLCRAQDIGPDNVVLSKDLIDLEIRKDDRGQLRDGYKRGWLTRFLDRNQPF